MGPAEGVSSSKPLKSLVGSSVIRAVYRNGIAFSRVLPGGEGLDVRKGEHPDADRARHTAGCVGCEKNNAVRRKYSPYHARRHRDE